MIRVKTKTKVGITTVLVTNRSVLNLNLKAKGGAAIHIFPTTKDDLKTYKLVSKKRVSVII